MSVIVKGMGMPENCDVCRFSDWSNLHQTTSCKLKDYEPCFGDFSKDFEWYRSEICPLVEIPEGARLIDGNALIDSLGIYDRDDYCEEIIDDALTVFEED